MLSQRMALLSWGPSPYIHRGLGHLLVQAKLQEMGSKLPELAQEVSQRPSLFHFDLQLREQQCQQLWPLPTTLGVSMATAQEGWKDWWLPTEPSTARLAMDLWQEALSRQSACTEGEDVVAVLS